MKHIGILIKERRRALGINQKELSSMASISQTYLSQLESGDKKASTEMQNKISEALGCPYVYFNFFL